MVVFDNIYRMKYGPLKVCYYKIFKTQKSVI